MTLALKSKGSNLPFQQNSTHRRFNPLNGDWVLVSPDRTDRPWGGEIEKPAETAIPTHDPQCYLCPGAVRANGAVNPLYKDVFAFDNDFAALRPNAGDLKIDIDGVIVSQPESGRCRVVCYSPRHDLSLSRMSVPDLTHLVETWRDEYANLGACEDISYVQIFENRGAMMGASNPHPHCQIWATQSLPNEVAKEAAAQHDYLARRGRACYAIIWRWNKASRNESSVKTKDSLCLFHFGRPGRSKQWSSPKRHIGSLNDFGMRDVSALADILSQITIRYDNLFDAPFPYSMGFHQSPTDGAQHPHWHFHGHFYPPLLRSASIRKFMVGFELLGSPQRDITPELAAKRLQAAASIHYLDRPA